MSATNTQQLLFSEAEYNAQKERIRGFKNFQGFLELDDGVSMYFTGGRPRPHKIAVATNENKQLQKKANALTRLRNKLNQKKLVALLADSEQKAITDGK